MTKIQNRHIPLPTTSDFNHQLPGPRQPGALPRVLGQQVQAPGPHLQQQPQAQLLQGAGAEETASFLGKLMIQGMMQLLRPQEKQEQKKEKQEEQQQVRPLLEQLLGCLTLPQSQ